MARRNHSGLFTLEDIHRALSKLETVLSSTTEREESGTTEDHGAAAALATMQAVTSEGSNPFDDALHEYALFTRPTDTAHLEELVQLVGRLVQLCGTCADDWKIFMLVAFRRRYHAKAPAAKEASKGQKKNEDGEEDSESNDADGDGERLIFYVTCLALHRCGAMMSSSTAEKKGKDGDDNALKFARAAVKCMVQIAPNLGGTRDVNAMVEHLCFDALLQTNQVSAVSPTPDAPDSFKEKLVPVAYQMMCEHNASPQENSSSMLDEVVGIAASMLDKDLEKCHAADSGKDEGEKDGDKLLSTIHVTLPHNKRGNPKTKTHQRNLANCVAELLIWQRTSTATRENRFSNALSELRRLAPTTGDSIPKGHECILQMQTTARKQRKLLNDHARAQGFLLCSSYLTNRSAISLRLIRRAKAGDLAMLTKLAQKNRDSRILELLLKRNIDPSKATVAESINEISGGWRDIRTKDDEMEEEDTIESMELQLQSGMVRATVEKLHPKKAADDESERRVLVASVGHDTDNNVCAVLVAAALHPNSRLILGSKECTGFSTNEGCLELLNDVILGDHMEAAPETQRTIEDIISTELEESEDAIILSSSDLQLDEAVLRELQEKDIRIRVHSTSRVDFSEPTKVELNSKISERLKSGASLSLAVVLDCTASMGQEIKGCKEGALKLISKFNDLAPVKHANFLGYWDPVNVRTDPQPRSTGYLSPNKENLDKIQAFVNEKLPCMGGGDEPEDVPAALEHLLQDIKKAGLSSEDGVHLVFFVADAGFRTEEDARVTRALKKLKDLGVVMVMCPVRLSDWGGSTCQTLVNRNREAFQGAGQYIELEGVGQLQSIATTVTESIRASLFKSGNVVSVTASVGETMDAIGQLCSFQRDHTSLKKVAELSKMPEIVEKAESVEEVIEEPETMEEDVGEAVEADVAEDVKADEDAASKEPENVDRRPKKVFATAKVFQLTSKDRLYLQLSRLPAICHTAVETSFGGKSLREQVASEIAQRFLNEGIPVSELYSNGYPSDLIELVRGMMGGHGRKRKTDE